MLGDLLHLGRSFWVQLVCLAAALGLHFQWRKNRLKRTELEAAGREIIFGLHEQLVGIMPKIARQIQFGQQVKWHISGHWFWQVNQRINLTIYVAQKKHKKSIEVIAHPFLREYLAEPDHLDYRVNLNFKELGSAKGETQ